MISVGSYKSRKGRMIPSRQHALDELWPIYGITEKGPLDLDLLFERSAPVHMEIGFGMGDALIQMALTHPEINYLGIEVYLPGIGQLLLGIHEHGLTNIRIVRADVMEVLDLIPAESISRVYLFFPDPWPKKRHHKRRLVQGPFIKKLRRVLAAGGHFHAATDWKSYAQQISEVVEADDYFINQTGSGKLYHGPLERPLTKFEKRGLKRGHEVRDLLYKRVQP